MWSVWSNGIRNLLQQGFEFSDIIETFDKCMEFIISSLEQQEIPLRFAIPSLYRDESNDGIDVKATATDHLFATKYNQIKCHSDGYKGFEMGKQHCQHNVNSLQQNCLLYSYRMYKDDDIVGNRSTSFYFKDQSQKTDIVRHLNAEPLSEDLTLQKELSIFLNMISHGSNSLVSLAMRVWQRQLKSSSSYINSFNKENIITFVVPGYRFSDSTVVDGIVSKFSSHASRYHFVKDESLSYRSLLIGGDLTPNYTHLGFAPEITIDKISSGTSQNEEETWVHNAVEILHKLKVSALLVQGLVNEKLITAIQGSVIIVSQIPHSSLCKLAASTGCNVVSYLENCDEVHICNLTIKPLQLRRILEDKEQLLVINIPNKYIYQSVVICHELPYVANLLEHSFWHFINRLSNICTVKKLLLGRGQTEKFCFTKVLEFSEKTYGKNNGSEAEILKVLSDGFKQFTNKIEEFQNDTSSENHFTDEITRNTIYDDPLSKIEGWKAALKLSLLLSEVDSVIINDLQDASKSDFVFHHGVTL